VLAHPEAQVAVRVAVDAERERVLEDRLVAVCRGAKWMSGLTQRTTSSTALGSSETSRCSLRSSPWCWMNASIPPLVALRVVSLPAITMMRQRASTSIGGSGWPSTRAWVKTLIRSSSGLFFFSSTSFAK
jgi:hypothetical protein